jgi:hypothetical protein
VKSNVGPLLPSLKPTCSGLRPPRAAERERCAGSARRWLGHAGPLVNTRVVRDNSAASAPAQRRGGVPAAVVRRLPGRPTAPAAGTPALRSGASPRRPRRGAAEPSPRSTLL